MAKRNRTIPDDEAGIRRFVYRCSRAVNNDPAVYHLTQDDADLLMAEADALIDASIAASRYGVHTTRSIVHRNGVKKRVLATFRTYVQRVRGYRDISEADLYNFGITVRPARKSPIPTPASRPELRVKVRDAFAHEISYRRQGPFGRHKPRGATHMVLLCHVGETAGIPGGDPANLRYVGAFTRTPIRVTQRPGDGGKTATYLAAWLTSTGEQSPWSNPVSMQILGGGVVAPPMKLAA